MELEGAALAELAEACTEGDEIWAGDGDSELHGGLWDVEDAVFVQAEAVRFIFAVNERYKIFALECGERGAMGGRGEDQYKDEEIRQATHDEVGEFGENCLGLVLCEWAHGGRRRSGETSWPPMIDY